MPHLDDRDLDALAQLARLDLAGVDRDALRGDLERVLTYVDRLADVDDPSVAPLRHPALADGASGDGASGDGASGDGTPPNFEDAESLRADVPVAGLPPTALKALAPVWRDGWVVVPRTVDQEG